MTNKTPFRLTSDLMGYGVGGAYILMVYAARDEKELQWLHGEVIPEDCRLLREDYLVLVQIWRDCHTAHRWEMPRDGKKRRKLDENRFLRDFNYARSGYELSSYYRDRLTKGSALVGIAIETSIDHRRPYLAVNVEVCGALFQGTLWSDRGREWWVHLTIVFTDLTESLTHRIRSELPQCRYIERGGLIVFSFKLGNEFLGAAVDKNPVINLVKIPGFKDALLIRLQQIGVPATKVTA